MNAKKMHSTLLGLAVLALLAGAGCRRDNGVELLTPPTVGSGSGAPAVEADGPAEAGSGSGAATAPSAAMDDPAPPPVPVNPQVQADRELAQRLGLAPPEPLAVAHLLTHADVRELVQYQGPLAAGLLEGVEPGPDYNAIRLASDANGYGFALQIWRDHSDRQSEARFERLMRTYFVSTADPAPIGDAAFRAEFEGIRHYALRDRQTNSVVVITCQSEICLDQHIRSLAERVLSRL